MRRGLRQLALAVLLAVGLSTAVGVGAAGAATPPSGKLTPSRPSLAWQGDHFPLGSFATSLVCATGLTCDLFELSVSPGRFYRTNPRGGVRIRIAWEDVANDFDLFVFDADTGEEAAASLQGATTSEQVFLRGASGSYDVLVVPFLAFDSEYSGTARLLRRG
jgi:alpha-glucosidase